MNRKGMDIMDIAKIVFWLFLFSLIAYVVMQKFIWGTGTSVVVSGSNMIPGS